MSRKYLASLTREKASLITIILRVFFIEKAELWWEIKKEYTLASSNYFMTLPLGVTLELLSQLNG